jgi:putative PIN family toxin of toxin-antitoxin system
MTEPRPRVILDCNVLVQAILTPAGPGAACIALADGGRITLVTSRDTLAEARDVLNRPEIRRLKPDMATSDVDRFLEALAYRSAYLRDVPRVVSWPRDPKDEPYLNLAVAAQAQYLVTRDQDLLVLNSDHSDEAKRVRQLTRNRLEIVTPTEFLASVGPRA